MNGEGLDKLGLPRDLQNSGQICAPNIFESGPQKGI